MIGPPVATQLESRVAPKSTCSLIRSNKTRAKLEGCHRRRPSAVGELAKLKLEANSNNTTTTKPLRCDMSITTAWPRTSSLVRGQELASTADKNTSTGARCPRGAHNWKSMSVGRAAAILLVSISACLIISTAPTRCHQLSVDSQPQPLELTPISQSQQSAADQPPKQLEANGANQNSDQSNSGRLIDSKNLHTLMSQLDLQRTFQVHSHEQVPEYEVLQLVSHSDGSHLISPISDLGQLLNTHHIDIKSHPSSHSHETSKHHHHQDHRAAPSDRKHQEDDASESELPHSSTRHKRSAESPRQQQHEQDAIEAHSDDSNSNSNPNSDFEVNDDNFVMKLTTFGQDFKLRLKRNVDFQQRIKDMKMFMAESTPNGRLKYTEVKSQQRPTSSPSSVASSSTLQSSTTSPSSTTETTTSTTEASKLEKPSESSNKGHRDEIEANKPQSADLSIGSTYHDETNLAAFLIHRDATSGRMTIDGTIGNDYVIKPVLQSTVDSLHAHQREQTSPEAVGVAGGSNKPGAEAARGAEPLASAASRAAEHMHDDDPHDDDEMFLDEDEALEMAHQVSDKRPLPVAQPQANASGWVPVAPAAPEVTKQPTASSSLANKTSAERKWRKYRKHMAQTRVPKPSEVADVDAVAAAADSHRIARREPKEPARVLKVSHHFVYRQRPSSLGSSAEHKHSFMMDPSQMDAIVASQLSRAADAASTDWAEDPLGGQFYLEPGDLAGLGVNASAQQWHLLRTATNSSSAASAGRHKRSVSSRVPVRARAGPAGGRRHKRQAPDTVWPEVLLVVDYDSFLLHGGDSRDVKRYFVSFWNGVDLRYKLLVHPHIRISLAGMIVAKDRDATPYLERNRLRAPNADAVDAAGALTDMGKYLYREDRLPTYDLAVVITKLDMCRRRFEGARCNRGTAGFAYVGGACVVNKRLEKVNSVAIIEDSGGFSGIIVAAHEVGHLLGCVHDGSPPPSYLGGPGATHCPWEDGFIMSDLRHTERGFRWSQCSVEQFKHFLHGETATCLYNYPHESQMLHRSLPGGMLTLDEQCKRDRGTNACFKDARVCAQLFCFDSASGYCVSYRPAAEGSPCGEGQVCRNGKCVGDIENIIPDYSHQSQTVVSRRQPAHPGGPVQMARLATTLDTGAAATSGAAAAVVSAAPFAGSSSASSGAASGSGAATASEGAGQSGWSNNQLAARMDDGAPLVSSAAPPSGGRRAKADPSATHQSMHSSSSSSPWTSGHHNANQDSSSYLKRSGYQALAKSAKLQSAPASNGHAHSQNYSPINYNNHHQSNQPSHYSRNSGLFASATQSQAINQVTSTIGNSNSNNPYESQRTRELHHQPSSNDATTATMMQSQNSWPSSFSPPRASPVASISHHQPRPAAARNLHSNHRWAGQRPANFNSRVVNPFVARNSF